MELATVERYRQFLKAHGYCDSTIALYIRNISDIQEPSISDSPALLADFVDKSLLQKKNTLSNSNFKSARAALMQFFFMITGTRFKDFRKTLYPKDQYEPLMERFSDYCSEFLHLSDPVVLASIRDVRSFLITVAPDIEEVSWSMITAKDIVKFLGNECSNLCPASVGVTVTAIRRFFRFLRHNDEIVHPSVLNLPLSTPNWSKNSSLPVVLSAEDRIKLDAYEFPDSRTQYPKNWDQHWRIMSYITVQGTWEVHSSSNTALLTYCFLPLLKAYVVLSDGYLLRPASPAGMLEPTHLEEVWVQTFMLQATALRLLPIFLDITQFRLQKHM